MSDTTERARMIGDGADADAGRHVLREAIFGFARTQLVYVAAVLADPEAVAAGVTRPEDLAERVGADPDALRRVLRGLVAAGILAEREDGGYALTAAGEALREDAPGSLHAFAVSAGDEWYPVWGELLPSVRTGQVAFERVHGTPLFAWLAGHPDKAAAFNRRMVAATTGTAAAVLRAYDFSPHRVVVDLGGGLGVFLAAVLRAHPHLRGVLFDLPHVASEARRALGAAGVGDRCETVGGDFSPTRCRAPMRGSSPRSCTIGTTNGAWRSCAASGGRSRRTGGCWWSKRCYRSGSMARPSRWTTTS